ncbi:MAG: BamA/TamA family outer membrane protein, partial [Deltaproteobacteria bacterium]|nr:BamA/TamA family outer membrane protein [Deltaproteobacteria bacterium]
VPEVYEAATRHLTELYRSEGYLSAQVGPAVPIRRACASRAPGPGCVPVGERAAPRVSCAVGPSLPAERGSGASCEPDPVSGRRCEPRVLLQIPVRLGPRALLWDLAFEGNGRLSERELAAVADLGLGEPVSQVALEESRRRLVEEYQELGYAFADVALRLELSQDRTRARARFLVTERGEVKVAQILVRGARATRESRVLGRVALRAGGLYRKSLVRATEEHLGTLGVFSSVDVALEDPDVYAAEKVVIVTVRETAPQYLDVRPGFSTGDGFRITFEYGHRNLGGEAIRVTLRSQLGLLPDAFIFDPTVRRRFAALALDERLERRNTVSVEFPEVGLGPLFPLGIDGVDVRDNSRDFGLTKAAAIVTQSYRPTPRFVAQVGASLERNVADIFQSDATLEEFIRQNPATGARLRVPEGTTRVVAERASVTWDRRDDPFNATRGTLVSAAVENVFAEPSEPDSLTPTSEFLRLTGKFGGYLRLSQRGHSLALAVRAGQNVQLTRTSRTYPDRLFFSGGVDSLRGFLQDSLIPEDVAARIVADARRAGDPGVDRASLLTPDKVVIRGGNLVVSPRAELRVPLGGVLATAVFLDAGNLWLDPGRFDPFRLRTAAGTGLRANTPVGPLALDLGVNLARRSWEDPFAVHFSIGLF